MLAASGIMHRSKEAGERASAGERGVVTERGGTGEQRACKRGGREGGKAYFTLGTASSDITFQGTKAPFLRLATKNTIIRLVLDQIRRWSIPESCIT